MDTLFLLITISPTLLFIATPCCLIYSFFWLVLKSNKQGIRRWMGAPIFVVAIGLIIYGDVLLSSVQLARLCHTKAGVYVYKRVMVPDEVWDFERNRLKEDNYYISSSMLDYTDNPSFVVRSEDSNEHWGVRTNREYVYEYATGDRVFERFNYSIRAGWFAKSLLSIGGYPSRTCSLEQSFQARYTLDDIPQKLFTIISPYDGWHNAKLYAIHPESYIKKPLQ